MAVTIVACVSQSRPFLPLDCHACMHAWLFRGKRGRIELRRHAELTDPRRMLMTTWRSATPYAALWCRALLLMSYRHGTDP